MRGFLLFQFHACLSNWIGFRFIEKDDTQQTLTITRHDDRPRLAYSVQAPRPFDHGEACLECLLPKLLYQQKLGVS